MNFLTFESIPPSIYVLIFSLIELISISMFNEKLKSGTVTKIEYIIGITIIIGIILLFF